MQYIQNIRDHIAKDDLNTALQHLRDLLEHSPQLNEVIQQSGRYADIRKQIRLGIVNHADATLIKNQIRMGLIELLDEIEKEGKKPPIQKELQAAVTKIEINNSKNVVTGNIKADTVEIGDKIYQIYGERKIPQALTYTPPRHEYFLGRKQELREIYEALRSDDRPLLLVNGQGGVGKTTLATHYFREYAHEYAHTAWVTSEGNIADDLISRLQDSLGIRDQLKNIIDRPQRTQILLRALASLQKTCLLVLDNANDLPDLQAHYQLLRSCPNFHILLTTRINEFRHAPIYRIEGLPIADALQLFRQYYPALSDTETQTVRQIHQAVHANTLVIELLAKNLHQLNRLRKHYTLDHLLQDLREKGLLHLQSKTVHTDYGTLQHAKPEDIIAAMYDLTALPKKERRILSMLAILPPENVHFETLESLIVDIEELDDYLLSLYKTGWIDFNENDKTFKISPVVQEVVKKHEKDLIKNVIPYLAANLILKLGFEPNSGQLLYLNYQQAAKYVGYGEYLINQFSQDVPMLTFLCRNISNFFEVYGNLKKALHFSEKQLKLGKIICNIISEDLHPEENVAVAYSKLGEINLELGYGQKAIDYYRQEIIVYENLIEKYPNDLRLKIETSISYERTSICLKNINMIDEARLFAEKCLNVILELLKNDSDNDKLKKRLSNTYEILGDIELKLKNIENALNYYLKNKAFTDELIELDKNDISLYIGRTLNYEKLGDIYLKMGLMQESLKYLEEGNHIAKKLSKFDPTSVKLKRNLASSYMWLGIYYEQNNDKINAKKFYVLSKRKLVELRKKHPDYIRYEDDLQWVLQAIERIKLYIGV